IFRCAFRWALSGRGESMRSFAQLHRRLEKLTAELRPDDTNEFTLEELLWRYWQLDRPGFVAHANSDLHSLRSLIEPFQRRDAELEARRFGNAGSAGHLGGIAE